MLQQDNNNQTEAKATAAPEATTKSNSQHVETIREGAIGASIFLTERKDGSQGHSFKLSRSYKPDGQEQFQYSQQFYARNGEAIAKVATDAAKKCTELDKTLNN